MKNQYWLTYLLFLVVFKRISFQVNNQTEMEVTGEYNRARGM